jgi:hypothetical protein
MTLHVPFDLKITEKWVMPKFVNEGDQVVAPCLVESKPAALLCVVTVAAGNMARVENKERGFARWFDIEDLRIESPKGPRALRRLRDPA